MTDLVIVGAGGFARETAAVVHAINAVRPTWTLLGFLDDDPTLAGTARAGLPILGGLSTIHDLTDAAVVVCIGNPREFSVRRQVVERLGLADERYATLVHPGAAVSPDSVIGLGTVVLAHTVLTAEVTVGSHVAVMPQVVLTHDDVVGDYATLAAGVRLGGGVQVGPGAYLGSGTLVREGVHIGAWSLVGLGSVVLSDVPPDQVWVGNPARFLRHGPTAPDGPHPVPLPVAVPQGSAQL